jgi:hypothetical protein
MTEQQALKLKEILQYNLKSVRSHLMKEDFQRFWDYGSPTWAGKFLDQWCSRAMRSKIEPMKKVARMLRSKRDLILNWFRAFYLLFVMELQTRRVHWAGCTPHSHEAWMKQTARELTSAGDGFLEGKRYLIMDRDAKFSAAFRSTLEQADVEPVILPPRSPNLNAHLERFVGSLRAECLDRMIFFGTHFAGR